MDPDLLTSLFSAAQAPRWVPAVLCAGRLTGIFLAVPALAARVVPLRLRIAMMVLLLLSLPSVSPLLQPLAPAADVSPNDALARVASHPLELTGILAVEVLVGVSLGWFALVVLAAVRGAAVLISDQIGFSLGGVLDPLSAEGDHALRTFHGLLALVLFLCLDMHHAFLRALSDSFAVLPPGSYLTEGIGTVLERLVSQGGVVLFQAAFSVALPVVALLFFVSMVQGILTRVIPQLEFFVFGFPLRALVGLGAILISLPALSGLEERLFRAALEEGRGMLGLFSG